MFGIPLDQFVPIAQFLGAALVGLLAAVGLRYGQKTPTPAEKTLEVAGALVDSQAVDRLTAAMLAHTAELAASRKDGERNRDLGHRLCDALNTMSGETEELRRAIAEVTREFVRKR